MSEMRAEVLIEGTTRGMPVGDDFDYYSAAVAPVYFGIRPTRPRQERFEADFAVYRFGELGAARISVPAGAAVRDRTLIDQEPDDSFVLNIATSSSRAVQFGQALEVPSGRAVLLDCAVEGRVEYAPDRRLAIRTLRIPRAHVPTLDADPRHANRLLRTSLAGAQVTAQLTLLWEVVGRGGLRAAAEMTRVMTALLETLDDGHGSPTSRLDAYRAAARLRLADPDYGLASLARQFSVSTRTVQLTFAASGERFQEWFTGERLELAVTLLRHPEWAHRSVDTIARRCGFTDVSTFHRAFRRRFGSTPGALR